jgi:hypothetical protein
MSPPCVIFPPRRRPAVIVWLQTADDIRQTSTVQEEQGTTAAFDRARIMWFTVLNKEYAISLIFTHNRLGIFSDLLHPKSSYILSELHPYNSAHIIGLPTIFADMPSNSATSGCVWPAASNSRICCICPRDKTFGLPKVKFTSWLEKRSRVDQI